MSSTSDEQAKRILTATAPQSRLQVLMAQDTMSIDDVEEYDALAADWRAGRAGRAATREAADPTERRPRESISGKRDDGEVIFVPSTSTSEIQQAAILGLPKPGRYVSTSDIGGEEE